MNIKKDTEVKFYSDQGQVLYRSRSRLPVWYMILFANIKKIEKFRFLKSRSSFIKVKATCLAHDHAHKEELGQVPISLRLVERTPCSYGSTC